MYHLTKEGGTYDVYVICWASGLGKLDARVTLTELTPTIASHPYTSEIASLQRTVATSLVMLPSLYIGKCPVRMWSNEDRTVLGGLSRRKQVKQIILRAMH